MYYVYVLENLDGNLYYGSTNNLKRRLAEHHAGKVFTTTKGGTWDLIYYEAYKAESDARKREQRLKMYGQAVRQLRERLSGSRQHKS